MWLDAETTDVLDAEDDDRWAGESLRESVRMVLAPEGGPLSDQDVDAILAEALRSMSPEEAENFLKSLKSFGKTVGSIGQQLAPTLLPLAGAAVGTAIGGPAGTAIGGQLGGLAGKLIGGIGKPPAPATPPMALPGPAPTPSPVPTGGTSATAQLMSLLQNPALLQSLLGRLMGGSGKTEVWTGRGSAEVHTGDLMNALGVLAREAAREASAGGAEATGVPPYLREADGSVRVNVSLPEARARRLLEVLQASSRPGLARLGEDVVWEGDVYA